MLSSVGPPRDYSCFFLLFCPTDGPGWFCDVHGHALVPAIWGYATHFCDYQPLSGCWQPRCGDTLLAKLVQTFHTEIMLLFFMLCKPTSKKNMAALLLIYYVLFVWIKQSFLYELFVYVWLYVMYSKLSMRRPILSFRLSLKFGSFCIFQNCMFTALTIFRLQLLPPSGRCQFYICAHYFTAHVPVAHPPGPYQSIRERKMVAAGARGARSITETLDWICLSTSEGDSL